MIHDASGTGLTVLDFGSGKFGFGVGGEEMSASAKKPRPGMDARVWLLMLETSEDRLLDSLRLSSIACRAGFIALSIVRLVRQLS